MRREGVNIVHNVAGWLEVRGVDLASPLKLPRGSLIFSSNHRVRSIGGPSDGNTLTGPSTGGVLAALGWKGEFAWLAG